MELSGLILDVYDDFKGDVLRSLYPSQDNMPDFVKSAQVLSSEDRQNLPDDVFALVLQSGEQSLRKFACIDEGNTILSVQYFLKNAHKLPEEAQKVAASNLVTACSWYDIAVPELLAKIAVSADWLASKVQGAAANSTRLNKFQDKVMGTTINKAVQGGNIPHARKAMGAVSAAADRAEPMLRAEGRIKAADITGTCDMPLQSPSKTTVGGEKAVLRKTAASMPHLVPGHKGEHGDFGPMETDRYEGSRSEGKTPEQLPQARQLKPHCDVSTKTAGIKVVIEPSRFALPDEEKYPLDDYNQIKTASNYFAEYHSQFTPEKRHEYAMNLVKRANEVGLIVSDVARRYGNTAYADHDDMKIAYELRDKACAWDDTAREMLHELFEKRAELHPEVFARALGEFDKTAGISHLYGSHIPDNFFSTFGGFSKTASAEEVDELLLHKLARKFPTELQEKFASDFCEEFRRDPVGIFQSMPSEQKQLLMKMANEAA